MRYKWFATPLVYVFFFNATATTEIYTLSLHDALPISARWARSSSPTARSGRPPLTLDTPPRAATVPVCWNWTADRKSTRLNSSHSQISYAVFCLKKKIDTVKNEQAVGNRVNRDVTRVG